MAKNIFEGIIDISTIKESEVVLTEQLLEAVLELTNALSDTDADQRELSKTLDSLEELIVFKETIDKTGLDKGLASIALKSNFDILFTDSSVSLQGFIDDVDTAEDVQEVMMNGVADTIKAAFNKIGDMFKDLYDKVKKIGEWLTIWGVRAKKSLLSAEGCKNLSKEDWDELYGKNKMINVFWDNATFTKDMKALLTGNSVFDAWDENKIYTLMTTLGWTLDSPAYIIYREKAIMAKLTKTRWTYDKAGFNSSSISPLFTLTLSLCEMAINIKKTMDKGFAYTDKELMDFEKISNESNWLDQSRKLHQMYALNAYKYNCYMKFMRDVANIGNDAIKVCSFINSFKGKASTN